MQVGCYTLDLYCDNDDAAHAFNEMIHQFTGPNKRYCMRKARQAGWKLSKDGDNDLCPKCSGKGSPQ